jgi:hypothetical protein
MRISLYCRACATYDVNDGNLYRVWCCGFHDFTLVVACAFLSLQLVVYQSSFLVVVALLIGLFIVGALDMA